MKGQARRDSKTVMTEGVIWKQLIAFSIPLLIGNIFQQLYNTVDSLVVGRYIGTEALAAVSTSGPLINLIIGLFMGIATGAGIIISQYFGSGEEKKLSLAVHTCMALSLMGGVILVVLGVILSPQILVWMDTHESVLPNAVVYLRIYFCGSLFNLVYNMGAGVLRAVGDSRRPLYYLLASAIINTVLDFVFVVFFHMGTAGVGYATVIAQAVSMVLVLWTLTHSRDSCRLVLKEIRVDRQMMKRILKIGIPSGIQQSIISLSNVIVQANINVFGPFATAGFGSYNKIDGFVMLPLQSFCMAATTFTGQNIGEKKLRRVKQGILQGLAISLIYTVVMSVFLYFGVEQILSIFTPEAETIAFGSMTMYTLLPFYSIIAIHQIVMGSLRGAGKTMATMVISVGNMCVLRMLYINYITVLAPHLSSYQAVMWCYPITWTTTMLMDVIYSWKVKWIPESGVK